MSSTVVCGYSGANWEVNSAGQDACQQYAALVGTCSSTFTIGPVTPDSPPYTPSAATAPCACNIVAYNLQAACGWCQDAIQTTWWSTQAEWSANCTLLSTTYNPTALPASVNTAGLTIPLWAQTPLGSGSSTWSPTFASGVAAAAAPSTGASVPTTRATGGINTGFGGITTGFGGATTANTAFGSFTTGRYDPYAGYGNYVAAAAVNVGLILGIMAALAVAQWLIVFLVYYCRQKRRRAWYGPMGQHYREMGAGGGGLVAAPLLFHNEPNYGGGSPHARPGSLPPPTGHSPSPSNAYTAYQPPPPSNVPLGGTPYGVPYDNRSSTYAPPPTGGHEYPPGTPTPGTNPFNTPYGTPYHTPGAPPPGAGGPGGYTGAPGAAGGYTGHAEVY